MKIKRYSAPDMRSALRAVQAEQGPDAVILSSHETACGIELVAALDYDEALIQQARRPRSAGPSPSVAAGGEVRAERVEHEDSPGGIGALEAQIEAMREMLETRLDAVSPAYHGRSPARRAAFSLLAGIGLRPAQAARLAETLDEGLTEEQARSGGLSLLGRELPLGRKDLLAAGGALALIGPTGVGKTTTAAKLAARHILKFGQGSVQLVGTDEFRIGAQEQLAAYARILGAPLHRIHSATELEDLLRSRQPDELILIDTAGVGGRDLVLHQQFDMLRPQSQVHRALCLSAATDAADMAMHAKRFSAVRPNCMILTKLDETGQLGRILSYVLDQSLPLAYSTDGQQVPEDLQVPKAADLIGRVLDQRRSRTAAKDGLRACA